MPPPEPVCFPAEIRQALLDSVRPVYPSPEYKGLRRTPSGAAPPVAQRRRRHAFGSVPAAEGSTPINAASTANTCWRAVAITVAPTNFSASLLGDSRTSLSIKQLRKKSPRWVHLMSVRFLGSYQDETSVEDDNPR